MKCPIDQSPLKKLEKEGVFADCCNECHGIFLSHSGVKAFKHNYDSSVLEDIVLLNSENNSELNCPKCKNLMKLLQIENIEIDACTKCQSIWFDQFEMQQLIKNNSPEEQKASILDEVLASLHLPSLFSFFS